MNPSEPARAVFELRLVGKRNSRPARSIFLPIAARARFFN
jgi:hypothetical protein